ncbi:MAG TPA: ATP-binding protein [Candidatus Saccharibacteria bacterium]|jgi:predicted kinase|nr:ATP-binding protein [Candidatus Saccharibacteria bacterium]
MKVQTTKPLLVLLYGFPGAGKTHFARNLSENLACAHVHGDKIRYELFEEPQYDRQENGIVTQLMQYMSEEFLSAGINVIYDTNAMRRSTRAQLREMARKKGAKTIVVWFQMDPETAFDRTQKRDRRKADDKYAMAFTNDMFKRYIAHMQHPENTEDYVVVSGRHTYPSQQTSFFKKLMELGFIQTLQAQEKLAKPGLVNLVPRNQLNGRVDMARRNINIY